MSTKVPQGAPHSKLRLGRAAALLAAIALAALFRVGSFHLTSLLDLHVPVPPVSANWHPQQDSRVEVLRGCSNFACLRAVHALPPSPGERFNFPHFFVIGFPKCATTSLAGHLANHPQVVGPKQKEPWFFTKNGNCSHPTSSTAWGCDRQKEQQYVQDILQRDIVADSGLTRAVFEASTDYSFASPAVVAGIRRELPWLKLVVSMREPISQRISSIVHWGSYMIIDPRPDWVQAVIDREKQPRSNCSEWVLKNQTSMYECLLVAFSEPPEVAGDYHTSLPIWLATFPAERFHIVQYENLTTNQAAVLGDVERFVGLDPAHNRTGLPKWNSRKDEFGRQGWPMKRHEYEHLLSIVKPRALQTAAVLEQHGLARAKGWVALWEAVWQKNLDSCTAGGDCLIQVT